MSTISDYELLQSSIDFTSPLPTLFEVLTASSLTNSAFDFTRHTLRKWLTSIHRHLPPSTPPNLNSAISQTSTTYLPEVHFAILFLTYKYFTTLLPGDTVTPTERLYGFRRCHVTQLSKHQYKLSPLSKRALDAAIFAQIFSPYAEGRIGDWISKFTAASGAAFEGDGRDGEGNNHRRREKIEKLRAVIKFLAPYLSLSREGIVLIYRVAYLLGLTIYSGPMLHLLSQSVRRMNAEDARYEARISKSRSRSRLRLKSSDLDENLRGEARKRTLWRLARLFALGSVTGGVLVGWGRAGWRLFKERMRERREAMIERETEIRIEGGGNDRIRSDHRREDHTHATIMAPPPIPKHPSRPPLPSNNALCPLCGRKKTSPCACAVSGYVFCYRCLTQYIREKGKCPVTGLNCNEGDIVRVFIE